MQRLAIAIGALILMGATAIDWKLYGTSNLGREELRSFYGEIEVMPGGNFQVSTEDFTLDGLAVAEQSDRTPGRATSKLTAGYRPPIAGLQTLSNDELVNVTEFEELANNGLATPRIQTVRELDCAGKRMRVLSQIQEGVEIDADKLNLSWQRILPSTASANLLQLICH